MRTVFQYRRKEVLIIANGKCSINEAKRGFLEKAITRRRKEKQEKLSGRRKKTTNNAIGNRI
jgi:hypothetical protein